MENITINLSKPQARLLIDILAEKEHQLDSAFVAGGGDFTLHPNDPSAIISWIIGLIENQLEEKQ